MRLGIDFGTTHTVVAAADRGNYPVVAFDGPDGGSSQTYPSLIAARDEELRFGLEAAAVASEPEWTVLRSFKRLLAETEGAAAVPVQLGHTRYSVLELMTLFLEDLKQSLLARSDLTTRGEALEATVAVPANAHSTQRFLTLEAFRRAGFAVNAIWNEPTAAGVEYAHRYRNTLSAKRESIVVYDLGGGTFDVSTVHMNDRAHDVWASAGLSRLGGDDFDHILYRLVLEAAGLDEPTLPEWSRAQLLQSCKEQKERLNPSSKKMLIDLSAALEPALLKQMASTSVGIMTDTYYTACAPLVASTLELVERVAPKLDDVAGLYVVGGASALPIVARVLRERYGRRVHKSAYPSASCAIGLAIAGDPSAGFVLSERFARHFGVFREAHDGAQVAFDPLIAADTPRNAGASNTELVRTYRPAHNVGHYRFIECGWVDPRGEPSGDITPFADVYFPFAPELQRPGTDLKRVQVERTAPSERVIEERYAIQPSGAVELTITDLSTGYRSTHRLPSP